MPQSVSGAPLPTSADAVPFAADVAAVAAVEAVPRILEVLCRTTGMGFSAVARVTERRWVACAVRDEIAFGLAPGGELELTSTIYDAIRRIGEGVVIEDVAADPTYSGHPTPARYGFQSYISVPIRLPDGTFFGTLCAIDPRPARLKRVEVVEMFTLFADLIAQHLEGRRRLAASEQALLDERAVSQLREQFIAVLGHDLRNPLGSITQGAYLLGHLPKGADADKVREMMGGSVARMTGLIDDVLDFARGRLGGGLALTLRSEEHLDAVLGQVVLELEVAKAGRAVVRDIQVRGPVTCDRGRLSRLVSNLLANAFTHGDPEFPIRLRARTVRGALEVAVTNRGPTIPSDVAKRLFEPFVRGAAVPGKQGLGPGLYIAAEIARAHGGTLLVESADEETCFTFRMSLGDP